MAKQHISAAPIGETVWEMRVGVVFLAYKIAMKRWVPESRAAPTRETM